ncbi:MAG: PDZ domain-containing protein, partial [Hyphomicrobiaceae bacterium]
ILCRELHPYLIRSPLAEPGLDVTAGDYVLGANGAPLDPSKEPYAAFEGLADQTVALTVNSKPTMDGAHEIRMGIFKRLNDQFKQYVICPSCFPPALEHERVTRFESETRDLDQRIGPRFENHAETPPASATDTAAPDRDRARTAAGRHAPAETKTSSARSLGNAYRARAETR